jgi:hypothetical protein
VETSEKDLNQHWLLVQEQAAEFLVSQAGFLQECVLLHQRHHALVLSQLAQGQTSLLQHPPQDEEMEEDDSEDDEEEDEEDGPHKWSRGEEKKVLRAGSQDDGAERAVEDSGPRLSTHEDQGQVRGQVAKTVTVLNWGRSHFDRGVPRHVSDTRQAARRSTTEEQLPPAATEGRKMAWGVARSHGSHGDMHNAGDTEQALDADEVADSSDASHGRVMAAVGSAGQARSQAHLRWAEAQSRADEAETLLQSAWGGKKGGKKGVPDSIVHPLDPATPPPPNASAWGKKGIKEYSPLKMVRVLDKDGNRCVKMRT